MKRTLSLIAMAPLFFGCEDNRPIKSVCDCENVRVLELENKFGTLNGTMLTYSRNASMGRGAELDYRVCNPEALSGLTATKKSTVIRFSGDVFRNCGSSGSANRDVIHVREIALYKD